MYVTSSSYRIPSGAIKHEHEDENCYYIYLWQVLWYLITLQDSLILAEQFLVTLLKLEVTSLLKMSQCVMPGNMCTGAEAAMAPLTTWGYFMRKYAASIPPYDPKKNITIRKYTQTRHNELGSIKLFEYHINNAEHSRKAKLSLATKADQSRAYFDCIYRPAFVNHNNFCKKPSIFY